MNNIKYTWFLHFSRWCT